jgi:hypothetical protein
VPATITVTIPAPGSAPDSSRLRRPQYIPASVRSIAVQVLQQNGTTVNDAAMVTSPISPGTAPCGTVSGGDYTCVIKVNLPPGTDTTQMTTYDGTNQSGNVLSQQVFSASVTAGKANSFTVTLDANPGAVSVAASSGGVTGTYPSFTVNGTAAVNFTVGVVDAHGTAFGSQSGQPAFNHAAATGTGASASVSGTTMTVTPPSSGTSTNVVVDADPAAATDVSTTLNSSPAGGATSFAVASATGIYAGQNLVLDYETFSGSTLLQESVHVTNVSGTNVTISPGLAHAHVAGAAVRHYGDNLSPSIASFTIAISATLIAPVGCDSNADCKALVYNTSFSKQTGALTSTTEAYSYARFDTADDLFIADQDLETVYKSRYTVGTGFGSSTTYSGIPGSQPGNFGFDVSSSGAVVVENSPGTTPELDAFAAGSSSAPTTFTTSTLNPTTWQTITEFLFPTAAVLSDGSGNVFGYAFEVLNVNGTAHDQIVVTSGSSEQDINSSQIASVYVNDPTSAVLTWDVGRQSLIYVNSDTGSGSSYAILEFPRSGTTNASLQTTPTTVGAVAGYPGSVAASRDGSYVAVAWNNGSATSVTIFHNNGSSWSSVATLGTTFPEFTAMHFVPSGNLVVVDSGDNGTNIYANLWQFTNAGALVGSGPYNAEGDFSSCTGESSSCYIINDAAISY